ncbi:MAG: APC family permease [Novosphingobium sp.]|nr:APC family permease [Novosphingobium sp.]
MTGTSQPQHFTRSLSGFGVIILTLSVLSPGVSIFVSGASIIQQAGTGAVLAFVLGSAVCYCQTAMSAELGAAYPTAGADYASVGHAVGDWAGATLYIATLINIPLFLNTSAVGIATYLHPFGIPLSDTAMTLVVVATATVLSLLNIRSNEYVTGVFMVIEIAALLLVAGIGAWHFHPQAVAQVLHPQRVADGAWIAAGVGVVGIAVNNASWALAGSSQALFFSEDMKHPRTIGRIIMLSFAVTVVLECAPVIGVIAGAKDLHAVLASPAVFETFLTQYLPSFMLQFVSLAIALAIFNACLAGFVGIGRQVFSMARTRLFAAPINAALMQLTPRNESPWVAILAIGASTAIATYIPLFFKILLLSGGYTFLTAFYVFGVFRGRATGRTGHHDYRTPAFPLIPALGVLVVIGEIVVLWLDADAGRKSLLITAGLYAAAYSYYRLVLARRPGGWSLTGPADIDAGTH